MSENIQIFTNSNGLIETDDDLMNKIIRESEEEMGAPISMAIPAIDYKDNPDEKVYLLLLSYYDDGILKDWEIKIGRQNTYDYLKFLIKDEQIDPNQSFIISSKESCTPDGKKDDIVLTGNPITVFRFVKIMFDNKKVLDDNSDFDINEFDHLDMEDGDKTILEV